MWHEQRNSVSTDKIEPKMSTNQNTQKPPHLLEHGVMLSVFERFTNEQLIEEERVLTATIEAAQERLSSVERELFYRKHPECRNANI